MAERDVIVDKKRLTYEGLFSVKELYKLIEKWLDERNFDKREMNHVENVHEDSKDIELELQPWRKITDYANIQLHIRIIMTGIKEVVIEKDNMKINLNQGKLQIIFTGFLVTDYEDRWEHKPIFFFLRTIFDKYLYKPFTSGYKVTCDKWVNELHDHVRDFLNLYKGY